MRNEQHCDFSLQLVDRCGEVFGGLLVQAAGSLIENQYLGLFKQGTRNCQPLFLAAGQAHAALADFGLVAIGKALDHLVNLRHLAGVHRLLKRRVRVGDDEVVVDGAREQDGFLRHHAEVMAQFVGAQVADVVAVDLDLPAGGQVEPLQQLGEGALARA